ncbi:MAG: T9SS type A sorting domain-containing protein [Bacteroidales bacterium]|nr:T9SS type A sorting domain-containing protein [Bacteroidales bacterium]
MRGVLKMATLFLLTRLVVATGFAQQPKGNRVLAWQVDVSQANDYVTDFQFALDACMESAHLFYTWSGIEADTGAFDSTALALLDISNAFYPAYGIKAELQLAPINTTTKETPADLMNLAIDHPRTISRFKTLLDTVFSHIPHIQLSALNIGNEHDIFFANNAQEYMAYITFLDSVVPYAKAKYKSLHAEELKVGSTFTFGGLTNQDTKDLCKSVNHGLDIVAVTYYPLNGDFTMKEPTVAESDFGQLAALYPDTAQPLYFVECGYSSSTTCNSSEEKQKQFFENVFTAWDTHANNIKYLTIFKSTDWSQETAEGFQAYYGINDIRFVEYLRTLGVRTYEETGNNKLAYNAILCQLSARGWCNQANCTLSSQANQMAAPVLKLFPNPAQEYIQIIAQQPVTHVELFNASGSLVKTMANNIISIAELPRGLYVAKVCLLNGSTVKKTLVIKGL